MKCKLIPFVATILIATPVLHAQLSAPQGIIFDTKGRLWVANSSANNVQQIDPTSGNVLATITEGISNPTRLAFDAEGRVYVANESANTVTVYDANLTQCVGKTLTKFLSGPAGVVADAYGDVFVSNNQSNSVNAYNFDTYPVERYQQDRSGFQFTAPNALAIHGDRIYVSLGTGDGEDAVISYNVGEFLTGDARERVFYTDGKNTGPTGIAFDAAGNVYVSEFYSNSWVKFDPSGKLLLVVSSGVLQPEGIAVDASGYVYVANATPNNITVYNPSGQLTNTLH